MAQNQVALDVLVKAMNGQATTSGWDIVTSYTAAELNAFLKRQYDAGKFAKQVTLETDFTIPFVGKVHGVFVLNFLSPELSFEPGVSGTVNLVMPIGPGSTYTLTPLEEKEPPFHGEISDKYSIVGLAPMAAVTGDESIAEHGQIITFSQPSSTGHIVIHFKSKKGVQFSITPPPGPELRGPVEDMVLRLIRDYFQDQVDEIDYAMAGVTNETPATGATLFTPKAFAFASCGDEHGGCLSLYIQTAESGNPAGNPAPSFEPSATSYWPVPQNHTASMIMSYDLVTKAFLAEQLKASGFTVVFEPIDDGGIAAKLAKPVSIIAESKTDHFIWAGASYDGLSMSMQRYPLTLTFREGKVSTQWTGKGTSNWTETNVLSPSYGVVDLTIDLQKGPFDLCAGDDGVTVPDFSFTRSDFTVHTHAHSCLWYHPYCSTSVPRFYHDDMKLKMPDISIRLHGFDYFRETNLLAPGKKMIKVDTAAGVSTPHDFLVVGSLV